MKKEVGLLHLAVMLFGLAGVIGKFVTLPAILITFGRVSFSSIFLLIIILIKKEKVRNLQNKKRRRNLVDTASFSIFTRSYLRSSSVKFSNNLPYIIPEQPNIMAI